MAGDHFLLRAEGHHYFYYRMGEGITVERRDGADCTEESLWLNGSVYSAIASMNALLPIHASAVANDGAVFGFTGPPGAGKSARRISMARFARPRDRSRFDEGVAIAAQHVSSGGRH